MRRRARRTALLLSLTAIVGCGGQPTSHTGWPPGQPPPSAGATTAPAATPVATAPPPVPAVVEGSEPQALTGVLHPLAVGNIHRPQLLGWQRDRPVVSTSGWGTMALVGVNERDQYVVDERNWDGLSMIFLVDAVGDFAGDALVMGFSDTGRAVGEGYIFARRNGGTWRLKKKLPRRRYFAGMHRWSKGRVLALESDGGLFTDKPRPPRFVVVDGALGGADLPRVTLTDGKDFRGRPTKVAKAGNTRMIAFESGHVYLFGSGFEHWKPGATKGTVVDEGVGDEHLTEFAKRGASEVYGFYDTTVTKVDGERVERFELPVASSQIRGEGRVAVTDDGTIWVATRGQLWRMPPDGAFARIAFPAPGEGAFGGAEVVDVAARGDRVWVSAAEKGSGDNRRPTMVAWTGPEPAQLSRFELEESFGKATQYATQDLNRPKPAGPDCESIFALFYGITKYAAPGYDFPKARGALKGHTELASARFVKTDVRGQKYFGAFVPTLAQGQKIVQLIADEVEGSTPQLLCHRPPVVAELAIDLRTGATTGWTDVKP